MNNSPVTGIPGPRIVAIGGGHGLSTMLRGLKHVTRQITAIVTMADDGGGSGILRQEMGMLPPGDVRICIEALANTEPVMEQLLSYRFTDGRLKGQSFGNLFLAALNGITGSFEDAVSRMADVLAITGRVLPVTTESINLEATFENGRKVLGESRIFYFKREQNCRITQVRLIPERPPALPCALEAISNADMIVLGPGSLYTSVIPNLLVDGIAEAIFSSSALKVYVLNIMTQLGETEGYTASDHVSAIFSHSGPGLFSVCLANSAPIKPEIAARYLAEHTEPTVIDREKLSRLGVELVERPMVSEHSQFARHNPLLLARELLSIYEARNGGTTGESIAASLSPDAEAL